MNFAWIGLHDLLTEGHFQEVKTNRLASYTNWGTGEPNNNSGTNNEKEQCVFIGSTGKWNDYPCYRSVSFVCESSGSVGDEGVILVVGCYHRHNYSLYYCLLSTDLSLTAIIVFVSGAHFLFLLLTIIIIIIIEIHLAHLHSPTYSHYIAQVQGRTRYRPLFGAVT